MKNITENELTAIIAEHESDYWELLANNRGGTEELREKIERLMNILKDKNI